MKQKKKSNLFRYNLFRVKNLFQILKNLIQFL